VAVVFFRLGGTHRGSPSRAASKRVAQGVALGVVAHGMVALVADQEQVFGALAEGGDARIVHAQALFAQHAG
jgi:hypothetical protein